MHAAYSSSAAMSPPTNVDLAQVNAALTNGSNSGRQSDYSGNTKVPGANGQQRLSDPFNEKAEIEHSPTPPKKSKKKAAHFPGADGDDENANATTDMRIISNDGKIIITEEECWDELGYAFPTWKKWSVLSVIFLVQVSMNFNTSLYSNAIPGISEQFGVSAQAARVGAADFLILYAFGCELWAPWSEELGRKVVLQTSLFFVNIFQLPVALAPNFASIIVGRALGGLASAGGSVTLGMIADMWESDDQQYAVAFVVFSSVGGSVLGPVVGGFTEAYLDWTWSIWIQLIFGGFVQLLHLFVPETRTTVIMDRVAKRRRKAAAPGSRDANLYGPNEVRPFKERFAWGEIWRTWIRPFHMFLTEPIVLTLSLLSGFSDALVFMFIQSFSIVYSQWGFGTVEIGLIFIPILVGYFIAWATFIPAIKRNEHIRKNNPDDEKAQYESRLWWLLWTVPCLPIGLIGFAWTSTGPPIPWIASAIFAALIGIANYSIYMATIDYMICAYGPYSASATGGNGWSRDFLAGVLTLPATPFFNNVGLAPASSILFGISFVLVLAVYIIYWKGPVLRKRSPFAQRLEDERESKDHNRHHQNENEKDEETAATMARPVRMSTNSRAHSFARSRQHERLNETIKTPNLSLPGSRVHSAGNSRSNSRSNSVAEKSRLAGGPGATTPKTMPPPKGVNLTESQAKDSREASSTSDESVPIDTDKLHINAD